MHLKLIQPLYINSISIMLKKKLREKREEGVIGKFGGDSIFRYGGGYTTLYICQNVLNCTLKGTFVIYNLYLNF